MKKKNIIPQVAKPVVRVTEGTSTQLAEDSGGVLLGTVGIAPLDVGQKRSGHTVTTGRR